MYELHSQRKAYGEELTMLGAENRNVVVLEADLGKSTMSCLFEQAFPQRYFEMGIAEQDMLSTAAGLAAAGKIPFCSTFAVFAAGRAYDQIRQTIAIGKLNVKICGSSSGLSDFGDGATHQAIEDVAIMSAIPNMTVLTPCDASETRLAVRTAAEIEGPVYIRVLRTELPNLSSAKTPSDLQALQILREGTDAAIFAYGSMVRTAFDAAELLEDEGVSTMVVNAAMIKPFDYEGASKIAETVRAVVTAEEHTFLGGLASNLALALRQSMVPMDFIAVPDCFGQSAYGVEELLNHYGLTAQEIKRKMLSLLGR